MIESDASVDLLLSSAMSLMDTCHTKVCLCSLGLVDLAADSRLSGRGSGWKLDCELAVNRKPIILAADTPNICDLKGSNNRFTHISNNTTPVWPEKRPISTFSTSNQTRSVYFLTFMTRWGSERRP